MESYHEQCVQHVIQEVFEHIGIAWQTNSYSGTLRPSECATIARKHGVLQSALFPTISSLWLNSACRRNWHPKEKFSDSVKRALHLEGALIVFGSAWEIYGIRELWMHSVAYLFSKNSIRFFDPYAPWAHKEYPNLALRLDHKFPYTQNRNMIYFLCSRGEST